MYKRRCGFFRYLAAVSAGTLIAFYCPTKTLIILLAAAVIVLGLAIPKY